MSKRFLPVAVLLILVLLAPLLPACKQATAPSAYTAVVPAVLQAGSLQTISIALFNDDLPASSKVSLSLIKDGREVTSSQRNIDGQGTVQLKIPDIEEGDYTLRIKGKGFQDEADVRVENNFIVFLETDKPIYKPGQTINIRALTLDAGLKPLSENVTVDVLDAKGIKIFRQETLTDEYGMAHLDLPIASEPNLGTWKITAESSGFKTQLDVKVEEYVLPKYEIKVDLAKDWFLVNEPIKGKIVSAYSFGKPVKGNLEIKAIKYVGVWQEYARLNLDIDGEAEFTIPAASYVAGVPAAGGNGNVKLEFIVTEMATGYQEKTDSLLTVANSSVNLQIIPSGSTFKPGLPYRFLVVTETPDNRLLDTGIEYNISYLDKNYSEIRNETNSTQTVKGKSVIEINPPRNSVALTITCFGQGTSATKNVEAVYSPSGNYIHLEQISDGIPELGEDIKFWVYSTREAVNFYYEVISGGTVVFSGFTGKNEITLKTSPAMAPSSKLLVYQILPNSEVAADYLPFKVSAQYPHDIEINLSTTEAKPGDNIAVNVNTEGEAEIGIAAVDKSVYILAENRMNLQQVLDELEKLYMTPQAELHEVNIYEGIQNKGAREIFRDAGVIVLSNKKIPQGRELESMFAGNGGWMLEDGLKGAMPPRPAAAPAATQAPVQAPAGSSAGLAEVQRIRQFFPETWIWDTVRSGSNGRASLNVAVPDTITTWMLRAVAVSKTRGLGIAETQLKVFQPFFLTIDLPYSTIRGEEFPVKVAVYNYLDQAQDVSVEIQSADWFALLGRPEKTISLQANDIGSAEFTIKPEKLGTQEIKITARSRQAADAVIKTLLIEPEGAPREVVQNITLSNNKTDVISTAIPRSAVKGSARAYLAVTSSYLTQTIEGLESLIQMPFGCGEQNMIIFAPDVYITRYLKESGQLNPEIMAKAEKLMLTGYQRELTYRRTDGSFSAFGQSDKEGSLWLTAFVLKCFSEAEVLIYIDKEVLGKAADWILSHQNADGSFDAVGFVHHQEMIGGISGSTALTAYITVSLLQAGEDTGSAKSVRYLENKINEIEDTYTVALVAFALELAGSPESEKAVEKLMQMAQEDENGIYWDSSNAVSPEPDSRQPGFGKMPVQAQTSTSAIETTAYAALALLKQGDNFNASRAVKWLASKRNAYGGFSSTQDTVMALQALIEHSQNSKADVDLVVKIKSDSHEKELKINSGNFDILQIVDIPVNEEINISARGKGEAIAQIVQRYNLPEAHQEKNDILKVDVKYDADEVAVNDTVKVSVNLAFNPPEPMEAGMLVLDIAVPTGFAAVSESIDELVSEQKTIKRYDKSGRKVIFYIENMFPGDEISFALLVKALYPVKARGVTSQAYSYYKPDIAAESLSQDISVFAR